MRGAAIPLLVWGLINLVLVVIDWIGVGTGNSHDFNVNLYVTGFMLLVIWGWGVWYILHRRESIRRGPPAHDGAPFALPRLSLASAGLAVSVGLIAYGIVFGKFLVFIGIGALVLSVGRLGRELIAQQRTMNAIRRREEKA